VKQKARILIIDDSESIRFGFGSFLRAKGYEVLEAESGAKGLHIVRANMPDLVLVDLKLPDADGLELLSEIRSENQFIVVIVVTAFGSIEEAVIALKLGAENFLTKPFDPESLLIVIEHALEILSLRKQQILKELKRETEDSKYFFGSSAKILQMLNLAGIAGEDSNVTVLIRGETGTGKGKLAHWIHERGDLRAKLFVELNCAGLSKELLESELFGHEKGAFTGAVASKTGLLEIAHGGTLFLDEISEMEMSVQAKLLEVLEEKKFRRLGSVLERFVDIRLIAASHRDLSAQVKVNQFREDLFYRLNVMTLELPALRDRKEDIGPLAEFFLNQMATKKSAKQFVLTQNARVVLQSYDWPGNIGELRNVLERAVILSKDKVIDADLLPIQRKIQMDELNIEGPPIPLREMERKYITQVLANVNNNYSKAAAILKVNRNTLYNRLRDRRTADEILTQRAQRK
jgi:DNA-binding NtrC family response regulator